MELIYADDHIVVAVKPARVLSTDEPGGMPELLSLQAETLYSRPSASLTLLR